ncbi:MAG: winged helix-turn-helix domain-containing protein [Desulfatibacillum sp.]|nr:winged helix-turn-helix domain-containing protein [Desulfatibacillum sp.]
MPLKDKNTCVRSKIWLQNKEGEVIFGHGRIKILKAIQEHGSINAAAQSLSMSYRGAWKRIKNAEERLGHSLLESKIGGHAGGGSKLTPFALELMERFESMQEKVEIMADCTYEDLFSDLLP